MTITRPELHEAVAGQKSKASDYNENFTLLMGYVEDSIDENETYTQSVLSVYQGVNTLASSGTIALTDNSINTITPTGDVEFTLPTITGEGIGKFHQILVQVNLSTVYTIDPGTTYCFYGVTPSFTTTGNYNLIYEYDNVKGSWAAGVISKSEAV